MGNYHQHLIFGILVSATVGVAGYFILGIGLLYCVLAFMLCAVGALLPDLDHDDSIPLREVFNVAAAVIPFIMVVKLMERDMDIATLTVIFAGGYLFIRIVVCAVFKVITRHRGMFHSVPAVIIVGEIIYLVYIDNPVSIKWFLSVGGMLGFLSHLVLDKFSGVDFGNTRIRKGRFFSNALDLYTKSKLATGFTYILLLGLLVLIILKEIDVVG